MKKLDLNTLYQPVTSSLHSRAQGIDIAFDEIENFIVNSINKYDAVVGCSPWFSNEKIIKAMIQLESGVNVIVDKSQMTTKKYKISGKTGKYSLMEKKEELLKQLKPLKFKISSLDGQFSEMLNATLDCINDDAVSVFGTMKYAGMCHHKFLVLCKTEESDTQLNVMPKALLIGSFNYSESASSSRENVLVLENEVIAMEYFKEWSRLFLLSESSDDVDEDEINPKYLDARGVQEIDECLRLHFEIEHGIAQYEGQIDAEGFKYGDSDEMGIIHS